MTDAHRDTPLRWGESRELTPFETLMWRADGDPMMRSTMHDHLRRARLPELGGWTAL